MAIKLVARWVQVAASEVRICQVRAPFGVLLPQEILRAITAGRELTFRQIVSGLDAIVIQKGKEMIALFKEAITHGLFVGCGEAQ